MRKIFCFAVLFCLGVSVSLLSARSNSRAEEATPRYAITEIAVALGKKDNTVLVEAINNKGEIAGDVGGNLYLMSKSKTRILGKLPGSISCKARDINDKGEIVGTCSFPYGENYKGSSWPPSKFFLWKDGKLQSLSSKPSITINDIKINNRSQIIMGGLWENGRSKALGNWIPAAINDKGEIAGMRLTKTKSKITVFGDSYQAVLWKNGVETNIGQQGSAALLINNHRDIVLAEGHPRESEAPTRFFLVRQGKRTELTDYKEGGKDRRDFYISAMNEHGEVVGWKTGGGAFLWKDGKRLELNDLIPDKTGWDLVIIKDINDNGQIIGQGKINKQWHAFLLTPISQTAKPKP